MPEFKSLGERIKFYEDNVGRQLLPMLPAIIRLDGKAFHTFTKGLRKPFDDNLINLMGLTTRYLAEETNASCGYTQSDEITLVLFNKTVNSQIYFDGRVDKINSILAAKCSVFFNKKLAELLPQKVNSNPVFDCRCFNVPTMIEAANTVLWREQDAVRNSIQAVGQANFSHKELHKKSCGKIQEMFWQTHKINWGKLPNIYKRGLFLQKRIVETPFTIEELEKLPPKHEARTNPNLLIARSVYKQVDLPSFSKIINQIDVLFNGSDPETNEGNTNE